MVATSFNQGNEVKWGCGGTDIPGANGSVIGTGAQNTIDIEAGCTVVGRAADICANLTSGGYSDWFLPSKDELNAMYQNLHLKGYGNFSTTKYYWSSTEKDHSGASAQSFLSGQINDISKDSNYLRVRAVREF
jgi:hypothetical protein